VSALRSLAGVTRAARNQGLEVIPTLLREVLFECPVCKAAGLKASACVEILSGAPSVRCRGCERWGDDPFEILTRLGYDPDVGEPYEIPLRVFDLLWALERERVAA
jgi:hypothetical protein